MLNRGFGALAMQQRILFLVLGLTTLASLTGVGESKAQAIVAYRTENGPFKSSADLMNVKGIGERTVEKNADRLTVK